MSQIESALSYWLPERRLWLKVIGEKDAESLFLIELSSDGDLSCADDVLFLDRTGDATGLVFLDGAGDGAGSTLLAYACASVGASIGCDCAFAQGIGSYGSNFLDPSLSSLAFNLAGRFRSSLS